MADTEHNTTTTWEKKRRQTTSPWKFQLRQTSVLIKLHLPYFLDKSAYPIQGASFGISRRLPIIGRDGGPGG
jgi:hypothetical protein